MNIIEVKNNLVKLCYEEELVLSGLIKITDTNKTYIAQVLHLEATRIGKTAIAKLIFNYSNGISAYDGSIPSLRAVLEPVDTSILLETLDKDDPLNLGKLAEQKNNIIVNTNILKDNPIICAEKFFTTKVLLNNIALQLQARKQKIVVFDTAGVFKANKLTITKDFKLPLNQSTINYIYEKGFEDATAESKALIQAIFEELCEYSKTVEFIPFDTFKAVVDSEFMRTKLIQLIILKNKIKQIKDWNVFAQNENDFSNLKNKLANDDTIVINISCLKESLQKECIKYVYSIMKNINAEFYAFTPFSNENSDKFLLRQIYETENVHTTSICGYDYAYLTELKKCSKNMLMFTPLKQQKDFGGYNIFLQKLAEDEFIAYGKMTKFVPLIGKLHQMSGTDIYIPKVTDTIQTMMPQTAPETNELITAPVTAEIHTEKLANIPVVEEVITEEVTEAPINEEVATAETTPVVEEVITEEVTEAPINEEVATAETTPVVEEVITEEVIDTPIAEEVTTEEIAPVVEEISTEEVTNTAVVEEVVTAETTEVPVTEEIQTIETVGEQPVEELSTTIAEEIVQPEINNVETGSVEDALNAVPDIEDDEELSDDDLDMIEELSKPDDEIEVLSQETEQNTEVTPEPDEVAQEVPQEISEEPSQEAQTPTEEIPEPQSVPEQTVDEEIQNAAIPQPSQEPLQTRSNTTPNVPVYPSDIPEEDKVNSDPLQAGDRVMHTEFGEGVVEKMINYGDKLLCSVNFASVGRRLLNPEISEMKRI